MENLKHVGMGGSVGWKNVEETIIKAEEMVTHVI